MCISKKHWKCTICLLIILGNMDHVVKHYVDETGDHCATSCSFVKCHNNKRQYDQLSLEYSLQKKQDMYEILNFIKYSTTEN